MTQTTHTNPCTRMHFSEPPAGLKKQCVSAYVSALSAIVDGVDT